MFLILTKYVRPLAEVDQFLAAHRAFLGEHYAKGTLVCSGPQEPRTGGVIVARCASRSEVEALMAQDPFTINMIATYELIEFHPVKVAAGLEKYLEL